MHELFTSSSKLFHICKSDRAYIQQRKEWVAESELQVPDAGGGGFFGAVYMNLYEYELNNITKYDFSYLHG